ncbi:MAG: IscA/HesB family protein [Deltaproteobacteria bacterium]|nr:IscA/HesB family protein [Deltaproteobacteria bacterium]
MLQVTESAIENLKEYLATNNITSAIRVIMQISCSGTSLGLGLDDKKDSDKVFENDGVTFLVDDAIFATTGSIMVDYIKPSCGCGGGSGSGGFSVSSEKKLGRGGSCSTGSCSSGSCSC